MRKMLLLFIYLCITNFCIGGTFKVSDDIVFNIAENKKNVTIDGNTFNILKWDNVRWNAVFSSNGVYKYHEVRYLLKGVNGKLKMLVMHKVDNKFTNKFTVDYQDNRKYVGWFDLDDADTADTTEQSKPTAQLEVGEEEIAAK